MRPGVIGQYSAAASFRGIEPGKLDLLNDHRPLQATPFQPNSNYSALLPVPDRVCRGLCISPLLCQQASNNYGRKN